MRVFPALIIALFLVATVTAIHDYAIIQPNPDGYSGENARASRSDDPYSRGRYFGLDYVRQFQNFGSKGPTSRITETGAKSAYSGVFNLDTNTYSNQGRNPGRISNYDPNIRGYARVDRTVDLLPYESTQIIDTPVVSKGTARLLSFGNEYGAGLNQAYPKTQVFIQMKDILPLGKDKIYEAWLVDEQTGYTMSLGLMKSAESLTSSLSYESRKKIDNYEVLMVTREAYPDTYPGPSNEIVFFSIIDPTRDEVRTPSSYFRRLR